MIKESLKTLNLSDKEIDIYLYLLNNGPSLAPNIINKTGLNRTNVYTLISSLSDKGLVIEKSETKKRKTVYSVVNPANLYKLIEEKENNLHLLKQNFNSVYQDIKALYQSSTEKPIVQILSGTKGISSFYDKMLSSTGEILIFVSKYDRREKDHELLIEQNIAARAKKGITTRALNPHEKKFPLSTFRKYLADRKEQLTEVRTMPSDFVFPSQIIVFDNYVGITSLKTELITTTVENKNIADTMKIIFQFMWDSSLPFHTKLVKRAIHAEQDI
jgi:sugar-specific transcriptional regulator TrmB